MVFFRKQDDLTDDLQKELVDRLGRLTGKPSTSGLHIHPISNSSREEGTPDDEISVISSVQRQKLYKGNTTFGHSGRHEWHSDITFEPVPSDYALLRLTELPKTGGGERLPCHQWRRSANQVMQTPCGHLAMRSTIGFPNHIRHSLTA